MGRTGRTGDYAIVPSHSSRFHRSDSEDDAETDGDDDRDGEPRRIDSSKHAGVPQRESCASQQGEVADQVEMNESHSVGNGGEGDNGKTQRNGGTEITEKT